MKSVCLCLYVDLPSCWPGILNIDISTTIVTPCIKPVWKALIANCITNSCIQNTGVTWQGIDYKGPEDDTIVSKHVAVWSFVK